MTVGGLVGGANIIDQLLGRVNPAEAIGSVNGDLITPDQFNQAYNIRMETLRNAGTEISDQHIDGIREEVWNAFVEERLTEQAINDLGITVTDDEILYHLENNPPLDIQRIFLVDNEFDKETYRQALNTPGMLDWEPIEAWMRDFYIPRFKLQQYINMSAIVSEEEIREEFIKRNTDYTISALHITTSAVEDQVDTPTEEELMADYKSRKGDFEQDEKRHLSYVSWEKTPISEDTLRIYNEAQAIIDQANSGKDFAILANLNTQDPGNQISPDSGRGGDLGWFGKGQMVGPFEEAAFGAKKGDIVGPILSQYGYHIIKVDSTRYQESEERQVKARHILLEIDLGPSTSSDLRRRTTLFTYDAQDYGFSAALDSHNVHASQAKSIGEKDMFLAGLGVFRSAVRWAYNAEIGSISDPMENDDYYGVFILDSITPAGIASFENVRTQVYAAINRNKENKEAEKLAITLKNQVDGGTTFESLKKDNDKLELIPSDTKKLNNSFISLGKSNHLIGALLNAKAGDLIGPVETYRGYGLIQVNVVSNFDSTAWNIQQELVQQDLIRQKQNRLYRGWMANLKEEAKIVDNRKYYF
jgi:parvulin-like peptidyl-prolyl isomerase